MHAHTPSGQAARGAQRICRGRVLLLAGVRSGGRALQRGLLQHGPRVQQHGRQWPGDLMQ
eukprot:351215-Chlamydomonas_euryale.AAC.6